MSGKEPQTIDVNKLTKSQSFIILFNLLTKAQSKGVFTMDESVLCKYSLANVQKELGITLNTKKEEKKTEK